MNLAKSAVPSSRKINGKALNGDVSLSAGDVGAYPKSGGVVNGNVDATGYISGKGVYEAPGIRVYSSVNKPSPGELGAYTTGECDRRYGSKNTANKAANGWWKCGDTGVIYQWGLKPFDNIEGESTIYFPITFPVVCVNFTATVLNNSHRDFTILPRVVTSPGKDRVVIYHGIYESSFYWLAVGY
ncbi:hypothetical protein AM629_20700 [Photorhabdus heterorhabditis]|uniref:Putative tail fiber protein gp53-like C-terminal domain-containing protein n=1 Tax=Photorhabdus heterorhabditis TaxID=880156 RepID=A0ABR5K6U2_9GAMM|nr:hypothetical protein [Photorhabdus heterorhabditis]KOY60201.1 hypothetical protein AM629_20700 [Photorhabdus heterorhabditis]